MATYFDLAVTAPFPSFSGIMNAGVLDVTAPMPVFAGTLQTHSYAMAVTTPMPSFSGDLRTDHMQMDVTAPFPSFSGEMQISILFEMAVRAPFPSFSGVFEHPLVLNAVAPMPTFSGAFAQILDDLVLNAVAPFPSFNAVMLVGSLVSGGNTVLVMNLKNKVVSIYENYNFNSACKLNGVYLGAASDGIHILTGSNDNGAPIDASITLGDSDFGLPNIKMIPEIFVDYSGPGLEVFVARDQKAEMGAAGNEETGPYPVPATADGKTETKRAKLPGGFRGGNWQFRIENVDGGAINIQSIGIPVEKSQRRLN